MIDDTEQTTSHEEVESPAVEKTEDIESTSEKALVTEFMNLVEAPDFLRGAFERMQSDREYVAVGVFAEDDQDSVCVNQVLKNQQAVISNLGIDDPKASCKQMPQVGNVVDPILATMAETCELFLNRQIKQTGLAGILEGAAQDAQTNGIAWLKVSLQEDFFKDPVGQNRFNDQQENVAEYERLKLQYEAGEIDEDCADYQKFKDLDNTLKTWMADQILSQPTMIPQPVVDPMTGMQTVQMVPDPTDPRTIQKQAIIDGKTVDLLGCPELPRYLGFAIDQLLPEDVRWDWSISRPEEIRKGEWIAYRVFMTQEQISAKFKLDADEWRKINLYSSKGSKIERRWSFYSPSDRPQLETTVLNDRCAVWTMEHRVQGRRYVFVDGIGRFLVNETLSAVGANPFSLFPIYFNRVSGKALPISDVQLQRDLQDEYNMLRTHDRGGRRASYPWTVIAAGAANKQDIAAIENRTPFQAVMLKKADDINKYIKDFAGAPYNPSLYDTNKVVADMQMVASIPLTGMGVQGEGKVATDLTLANQGMQKATSRRQALMDRTLSDILEWMAQVAIKVFPEDNIKAQCGMNAVWLAMSAEQLSMNFQIGIKGAVSGPPDFQSKMQFWSAFPDIVGKLMSVPGVNVQAVLGQLMSLGGITEDIRNYWSPPMMPPMPNAGTPPKMGGGAPESQGNRGVEGGAPPMQTAPSPQNLPNNPNDRLGM